MGPPERSYVDLGTCLARGSLSSVPGTGLGTFMWFASTAQEECYQSTELGVSTNCGPETQKRSEGGRKLVCCSAVPKSQIISGSWQVCGPVSPKPVPRASSYSAPTLPSRRKLFSFSFFSCSLGNLVTVVLTFVVWMLLPKTRHCPHVTASPS